MYKLTTAAFVAAFVTLPSPIYTDGYFGFSMTAPEGAAICAPEPRNANNWVTVLLPPTLPCTSLAEGATGKRSITVNLEYNSIGRYREARDLAEFNCKPAAEIDPSASNWLNIRNSSAVLCMWHERNAALADFVAMVPGTALEDSVIIDATLETSTLRYDQDINILHQLVNSMRLK